MTPLQQAAQQALLNFENMAESNWRNWQELASAEEFEKWVKRRASHMAVNLRKALADEQAQAWTCGYDESVGLCTSNPCCYQATPVQQAQAVEPLLWVRKDQLNQMASGFLLSAYRSTEGRTDLTPLFTQPTPPPAGERAKVGYSRFESWYSELHQSGKGSKQIAREAYEAGLNEAQQVAVPVTTGQKTDWSAA